MAVRFSISRADKPSIDPVAVSLLEEVYSDFLNPVRADVELRLVNMDEMQTLNRERRKLDEPTDVLSFPLFEGLTDIKNQPADQTTLLGSIVICPEKAEIYGETIPQLIHHGMLHICGFDHETDILAWQQAESVLLTMLAAKGLVIPSLTQ